MSDQVYNIVVAGLGGQGVITASDIISQAAFAAGYDVKQSEIHGMSQRGGSVSSDIRFGPRVLSPMVPRGEADFLLVVEPTQVENNRYMLRPGGLLIGPDLIDRSRLANPRSLNVALTGALSRFLPIDKDVWIATLKSRLAERLHAANLSAFDIGIEASVNLKSSLPAEACP